MNWITESRSNAEKYGRKIALPHQWCYLNASDEANDIKTWRIVPHTGNHNPRAVRDITKMFEGNCWDYKRGLYPLFKPSEEQIRQRNTPVNY